jgi:hypothetical protein
MSPRPFSILTCQSPANSDWNAPQLSEGQLAYASTDAVLAWRLWPILEPELIRTGRQQAYALQRAAIHAVTDMQPRGLGFDRNEHSRQVEIWSKELGKGACQESEEGRKVGTFLASALQPDQGVIQASFREVGDARPEKKTPGPLSSALAPRSLFTLKLNLRRWFGRLVTSSQLDLIRREVTQQTRSSLDSPLEETRFEPSVPPTQLPARHPRMPVPR